MGWHHRRRPCPHLPPAQVRCASPLIIVSQTSMTVVWPGFCSSPRLAASSARARSSTACGGPPPPPCGHAVGPPATWGMHPKVLWRGGPQRGAGVQATTRPPRRGRHRGCCHVAPRAGAAAAAIVAPHGRLRPPLCGRRPCAGGALPCWWRRPARQRRGGRSSPRRGGPPASGCIGSGGGPALPTRDARLPQPPGYGEATITAFVPYGAATGGSCRGRYGNGRRPLRLATEATAKSDRSQ